VEGVSKGFPEGLHQGRRTISEGSNRANKNLSGLRLPLGKICSSNLEHGGILVPMKKTFSGKNITISQTTTFKWMVITYRDKNRTYNNSPLLYPYSPKHLQRMGY